MYDDDRTCGRLAVWRSRGHDTNPTRVLPPATTVSAQHSARPNQHLSARTVQDAATRERAFDQQQYATGDIDNHACRITHSLTRSLQCTQCHRQ